MKSRFILSTFCIPQLVSILFFFIILFIYFTPVFLRCTVRRLHFQLTFFFLHFLAFVVAEKGGFFFAQLFKFTLLYDTGHDRI